MSELTRDEAREVVRLVLVADVEGRASEVAWGLARRLAETHGLPRPLTAAEPTDVDFESRNAFYWGTE